MGKTNTVGVNVTDSSEAFIAGTVQEEACSALLACSVGTPALARYLPVAIGDSACVIA